MRFFLDTFVGDGDSENPFRPATADGDYGIIDLRGVVTVSDGVCLVGAEGVAGTPLVDFGDTLDQRLKTSRIRTLANRLGLTLDQTDFRTIIAELLLLHGREDSTRWRPLKQSRDGRNRIFLGGRSVYDAPIIRGASFTDDFNRADENLEDSANWAKVNGQMSVKTNECAVDTNGSIYRCESAMDSDDHYVEAMISVIDQRPGINARLSEGTSATWDAYHYRRNGGGQFQIFEVTNNSFTEIGFDIDAEPTVPFTMRLSCNGSTISADQDGSEIMSVTDTVLTGQVKTGFRDSSSAVNQRWDDFEAADLAGSTTGRARSWRARWARIAGFSRRYE